MPVPEPFQPNTWPTLGVEIELQLVDERTMALRSAIGDILNGLPNDLRDSVKPEFMQCYAEINTGICRTTNDVGSDLAAKLRVVEEAAAAHGVALFWAATHPFSRWRDQAITPDERYYRLAQLLGETVVRPVTFGLHVHVGVASGDCAIRAMSQLPRYLPLLLALSANSPFWHGRWTGHHAHRIEVLEGFPTGGIPPRLHCWQEYLDLVDRLRSAGFIQSHRELWWDVRPNAGNGTVEVRICDMPPDLPSLLGLTAIVHCLVHHLAHERAADPTDPETYAQIVRQNRWRAVRYGMGAQFVDPVTLEHTSARKALERLVQEFGHHAKELDCQAHLESLADMISRQNGAERQMLLFERTGSLAEVVRSLVSASSLRSPETHGASRLAPVMARLRPSQNGTARLGSLSAVP